MQQTIISVIGGHSPSAREEELAEQVGRRLAKRQAIVVCGGLGGVMEAVCRGAKSEGGTTVGILPGNRRDDANPYVDIPICTGIGFARNVIVVKSGLAVIAIGGAFGTLSEIAHAMGDEIPVIGLETWDLSASHRGAVPIIHVENPEEAVDRALQEARLRAVSQNP